MGVPSQARDAALEIGKILDGQLVGIYLYGSAVDGGLKPDSDVDLFILVAGTLEQPVRREVIRVTLAVSGRPERRPLEITIVSVDDVVPWRYPPRLELQYGEWLREDALRGDPLGPRPSPDLAVLVTQIRGRSVPLEGPPADVVLDPVPEDDLRRAMVESLPSLLEALHADERNVILTLARMWVTVESGEIVPKDVAADRLLPRVERSGSRQILQLARDAYAETHGTTGPGGKMRSANSWTRPRRPSGGHPARVEPNSKTQSSSIGSNPRLAAIPREAVLSS